MIPEGAEIFLHLQGFNPKIMTSASHLKHIGKKKELLFFIINDTMS